MTIVPKEIFKLNAIPINMSMVFLREIEQIKN